MREYFQALLAKWPFCGSRLSRPDLNSRKVSKHLVEVCLHPCLKECLYWEAFYRDHLF